MFYQLSSQIVQEIQTILERIDQKQITELMEEILQAKMIVTCGAGRMGMMAKAFTMRLSHLGLTAYHIQDCNTPAIGKGDLLIASSGSGETKTICVLVEAAKKNGARVALLTTRSVSSMARLADTITLMPAPSKILEDRNVASIQPMTSLTEQSSLLFFDTLILLLMQQMGQTHDMLKMRHSILE